MSQWGCVSASFRRFYSPLLYLLGTLFRKSHITHRIHKEMHYKYILTILISISISGFLSGCGMPMWANVAHTVGDVVLSVKTGKSSKEHGLSAITGKDCQFIRAIDSQDICMSSEDYTMYLISMNCDIYAWDVLNRVYCKNT